MLLQLVEQPPLVALTGKTAQVTPELPQPIDDRPGQRIFTPGTAFELVDDQRRNHQLELLLEQQNAQGHDPPLAVAPFRQIQPHRGVYEEMQHIHLPLCRIGEGSCS
jgi:hypothetical protein